MPRAAACDGFNITSCVRVRVPDRQTDRARERAGERVRVCARVFACDRPPSPPPPTPSPPRQVVVIHRHRGIASPPATLPPTPVTLHTSRRRLATHATNAVVSAAAAEPAL